MGSPDAAIGILILALGASPALAQTTDGAALASTVVQDRRLRLLWVDVGGRGAQGVFDDAARELADIFGEADIHVDWRDGVPGEIAAESDVQVIVLESTPGLPARVMGAARHRQAPPHTVRVFLRAIRATLGFDPRSEAFILPSDRAALGRAVGRVIAHEIIHVYAPAHGHENDGLMRPSLDAEFLKQDRVHLATTAAQAVVAGICGGTSGTAVLAPAQ